MTATGVCIFGNFARSRRSSLLSTLLIVVNIVGIGITYAPAAGRGGAGFGSISGLGGAGFGYISGLGGGISGFGRATDPDGESLRDDELARCLHMTINTTTTTTIRTMTTAIRRYPQTHQRKSLRSIRNEYNSEFPARQPSPPSPPCRSYRR